MGLRDRFTAAVKPRQNRQAGLNFLALGVAGSVIFRVGAFSARHSGRRESLSTFRALAIRETGTDCATPEFARIVAVVSGR
jgi:hypothetical protein